MIPRNIIGAADTDESDDFDIEGDYDDEDDDE
jgi:hypothetical protein